MNRYIHTANRTNQMKGLAGSEGDCAMHWMKLKAVVQMTRLSSDIVFCFVFPHNNKCNLCYSALSCFHTLGSPFPFLFPPILSASSNDSHAPPPPVCHMFSPHLLPPPRFLSLLFVHFRSLTPAGFKHAAGNV